jgi:methyl-accepting chemotaxis protein
MFRWWSRVSLQVQAVFAVLLPCLVIAAFGSVYFLNRLNQQVRRYYTESASGIGVIGAYTAANTLTQIHKGTASPEALATLVDTLSAVTGSESLGLFELRGEHIETNGTVRTLDVVAHPETRLSGSHPSGRFTLPPLDDCLVSLDSSLEVACAASYGDSAVLLVSRNSVNEYYQQRRANTVVGLWALLAGILIAVTLALLFSGALTQSLSVVSQAAEQVAAGDVSQPVFEVGGAKEVQSMGASVNGMLNRFRSLLTQMTGLSKDLNGAAVGLQHASTDQGDIARQQDVYLQQVSATFEQLSKTSESISRSTALVEGAAVETNAAVHQAKKVVGNMVAEMSTIHAEALQVASAIGELNDNVQQVARIATVIKQVAERADMLALNAALEGSKAGESGRGFGVVALEMRKLSENIGHSAKDISRITETIRQSSLNARSRAEEGVLASQRGAQVAEEASSAFGQILELSRGTQDAAERINVASKQQRQSSEQAVEGARNLADLVKRGVVATEKTTHIGNDLRASVNALTDIANRFKI